LQETLAISKGIEKEYVITHIKNKAAIRDAFNKTGIIKK
jgi:hypothetical protein